jgi:FMN-dependent NADH-azoreductase
MKILHLDSSISGENSTSQKISAAAVRKLTADHPEAEVIYRDLAANALPHLKLADLGDHTLVDEFLSANVVVIGAPMYNFTVPTNLKAWLDRIAIAARRSNMAAMAPWAWRAAAR